MRRRKLRVALVTVSTVLAVQALALIPVAQARYVHDHGEADHGPGADVPGSFPPGTPISTPEHPAVAVASSSESCAPPPTSTTTGSGSSSARVLLVILNLDFNLVELDVVHDDEQPHADPAASDRPPASAARAARTRRRPRATGQATRARAARRRRPRRRRPARARARTARRARAARRVRARAPRTRRTRPSRSRSRAPPRSASRTSSSTASGSRRSCSRSTRRPASSTTCRGRCSPAINEIETDYGRNLSVSSAGAVGWMQFLPSTWKTWGLDANGDGVADPYNPVDAIFSAARYLHAAGASKSINQAIFAYNHASWYVQSVLLRAKLIGGMPDQLIGALSGLVEGHFPVAAPAKYPDNAVDDARQEARQDVERRDPDRLGHEQVGLDLRQAELAGDRRQRRQDRQGRRERHLGQVRPAPGSDRQHLHVRAPRLGPEAVPGAQAGQGDRRAADQGALDADAARRRRPRRPPGSRPAHRRSRRRPPPRSPRASRRSRCRRRARPPTSRHRR